MKNRRSTCKCTDAPSSYVSRISVGMRAATGCCPFIRHVAEDGDTNDERSKGRSARKDRAKSPNRDDASST